MASAHDFTFTTIDNKPLDMKAYAGKPVLVVNVASFCGFTTSALLSLVMRALTVELTAPLLFELLPVIASKRPPEMLPEPTPNKIRPPPSRMASTR